MNSFELGDGFFPDDILFCILARLPVKSLLGLKSVCKSWRKLLSSRDYMQRYSDASSENPTVWFREPYFGNHTFASVDSSGCFSEFTLDFLNVDAVVRYSCNGLLLCSRDGNPGALYVCNPTAREFKLLPKIRGKESSMERLSVIGMAVDPRTQRYKVVLGLIITRCHLDCFVFDSETSEWMRLVSSGSDEFLDVRRQQAAASIGCCLFWLAHSRANTTMFDSQKRAWKKIPLPDEIEKIRLGTPFPLELEGSLSVIQVVWVLKEKEWIFSDRVSLASIGKFLPTPHPITQNRVFIFVETCSHILVCCRRNEVWKEVYFVTNRLKYPLLYTTFGFRSTMYSCQQS